MRTLLFALLLAMCGCSAEAPNDPPIVVPPPPTYFCEQTSFQHMRSVWGAVWQKSTSPLRIIFLIAQDSTGYIVHASDTLQPGHWDETTVYRYYTLHVECTYEYHTFDIADTSYRPVFVLTWNEPSLNVFRIVSSDTAMNGIWFRRQ